MIIRPPRNFEYKEETQNLFLLYQSVNEKTFNFSPDTYRAPIMNSRLLSCEAYQTYKLLEGNEKYYDKYLSPIIEELLDCLSEDKCAKTLLGNRYDSIRERLESAKINHDSFVHVIRNLLEYLNRNEYIEALSSEIIAIVSRTKNQQELLKISGLWVAELQGRGFSNEYIYHTTKDFFSSKQIANASCVEEYVHFFDQNERNWTILAIVDKPIVNYLDGLRTIVKNESITISQIDDNEIKRIVLEKNNKHSYYFYNYFNALKKTAKVCCIKCDVPALDPYRAVERVVNYINILSSIVSIYDNLSVRVYQQYLCTNYSLTSIAIQNAMKRRTREFSQSYLPQSIKMLKRLRVSENVLRKLLTVFAYHKDALAQVANEKYTITILWSALETLLVRNDNEQGKGETVKRALIEVIQRTIIIKRIKYLQSDVLRHLKARNPELIQKYKLKELESFTKFCFEDDEITKEVQITLDDNPLLRSRLHSLICTDLSNAKKIKFFLQEHKKKIERQIERVYRSRNFLVHTGHELIFNERNIEFAHYYLDFIVNYLLAKCAAGEKVQDIYDAVEEAKADNNTHIKLLEKRNEEKTDSSNYKELLFGPSTNVLRYYSEHAV